VARAGAADGDGAVVGRGAAEVCVGVGAGAGATAYVMVTGDPTSTLPVRDSAMTESGAEFASTCDWMVTSRFIAESCDCTVR
jgi:hypothetical protein